jgi:hypothetical protein
MRYGFRWWSWIVSVCCVLVTFLNCQARAGGDPKWSGEPVSVAAVEIQVLDPPPNGPDWNSLSRALLGIAPGDTLDGEGLEEQVLPRIYGSTRRSARWAIGWMPVSPIPGCWAS